MRRTHLRGRQEVEEEEHACEAEDVRLLGSPLDVPQVPVHVHGEGQHGRPQQVLHWDQPGLPPPEGGHEAGVHHGGPQQLDGEGPVREGELSLQK